METVSLFHTSNLRGGHDLSPVSMLQVNRLQLLQLFKRRQKSLLSLLAFRESYGFALTCNEFHIIKELTP